MDAMKWSFGIAARCAAIAVVAGLTHGAAGAAAGPPAWTVRYFFSTVLFGGTTADFDANGHFRILASSKATEALPNRRLEISGTLPKDELEAMRAAVGATHPELWSSSYAGTVCPDYHAEITLATRDARGTAATTKTTWGCRLTGLPADLRTLLDGVRGAVRARVPVALTDTDNALAGLPLSWPLQLTDMNGAVRRVTIDADGRIASRERTSTTLYALKACPQRDLGRVGPLELARMHAMLGPLGDLYYSTSADTLATFNAAMSDCPRPVEWLDANDYVIPADAHWAVQFTMQRGARSATVEVDSRGRADGFIYVFVYGAGMRRIDVPVAVDAAAVAQLSTLVGAVKENGWSGKLLGLDTSCVNHLRVARFYGGHSSQALTSVSCDNPGAPADVLALINLLTARFGAYAGAQGT
jgi:hypothetical protein